MVSLELPLYASDSTFFVEHTRIYHHVGLLLVLLLVFHYVPTLPPISCPIIVFCCRSQCHGKLICAAGAQKTHAKSLAISPQQLTVNLGLSINYYAESIFLPLLNAYIYS